MARKPKTRFLVLGLLGRGPHSGYDIAVAVREANAFFWHETFGSIYPMLRQLEDERLIRPKSVRRTGRRRRTYEITTQGRRALRQWLAEPPEPDVIRNELLLKLSFGDETTPGVLADHIDAYRVRQEAVGPLFEAAEARIATTEASERQRLYWRLTADLGRRVSEARLAWAKNAVAQVRRLEDGPGGAE